MGQLWGKTFLEKWHWAETQMSDRGSPEEGYTQRGHRHILPGSAHKTLLCPFNLIAEGSLLKPRKRPLTTRLYHLGFTPLLVCYWIFEWAVLGPWSGVDGWMWGSAHDETSVCGSPMLRLLGFESEFHQRCDFGQAIWRVKSQSPHLYYRKASSLGYWRPQETVHVKGWHTGSARKHGPLL